MNSSETVNILLIEDNIADVDVAVDALEQSDNPTFHVDRVARLCEAMAILEEETYDAILLDLNLPDSQGLETLTDIYEKARKVPIVVLSGGADQKLMLSALKKGAQEFVDKWTLNAELLSRTLLHAIQRHRIQMRVLEMAAQRSKDGKSSRSDKDIKASRKRYKTIVQENPDGILVVDGTGKIYFSNKAAQQYLSSGSLDAEWTAEKIRSSTGGEISQAYLQNNGHSMTLEMHSRKFDWEGKPAKLITIREVIAREGDITFGS